MALSEQEKKELQQLSGELSLVDLIPKETPGVVATPRPKEPTFTDYLQQSLPELGAMAGSVILPSMMGPVGTAGRIAVPVVRSMLGAGAGAALGTAGQQAAREIRGQEPLAMKDLGYEIAVNAAENMALDAAGNVVFNLAGKAFRISKDALQAKGLFTGPDMNERALKEQVQRFLQEEGATLSRYQAEPTAVRKAAESVAASGITGQSILTKKADQVNAALTSQKEKILDSIASEPLSDQMTGKAYLGVLEQADKALSDAVTPFYKDLANRSTGVTVDFNPIKSKAFSTLQEAAKLTETGNPATILGDDVARELTNINNVVSDLTFDQAHQYRSILQKRLRSIRNEVGQDSPVVAKLSEAVKMLDDQMDGAAKKLRPELLSEYRETSRLYKESINDLYPKALVNIITKTPERIGEAIYKSGNVSEIQDAYKALARAKSLNNSIDTNAVKQSLQRGFVEGFLKEEGGEVTSESLARLAKKFDDKKFKRTFEAALDKDTQNRVKLLVNAGRVSAEKPGAALSLFVAGKQADAISLIAGGGALAAGIEPLVAASLGAGLLFTPRVLAKLSTSPKAVNQILKIDQQQRQKGLNGGQVAQVFEILRQAKVTSDDYGQAVQQQAQQEQQSMQMTEEERAELMRLMQEQ